jgi:hypothetical protein
MSHSPLSARPGKSRGAHHFENERVFFAIRAERRGANDALGTSLVKPANKVPSHFGTRIPCRAAQARMDKSLERAGNGKGRSDFKSGGITRRPGKHGKQGILDLFPVRSNRERV